MKKTNITKNDIYCYVAAIFVSCLIISNVLAAKTFTVLSITLPCAVVIFPLVYIANDVMAEIFGFEKTRRVIFLGFAMNAIAVLAYEIAIALPEPSFATATAEAFATTLGSSWRVLTASFIAYLVGSLLNSYVMVRMKEKLHDKLMLRCVVSTFVGEGVDAIIFISIAFFGTMPVATLLTMIIAQAMFKTIYEIIVYPVTKVIIKNIRALN